MAISVAAHSYEPSGTYTDIGGLSTYVTGDRNATRAVVLVYDGFGITPPVLQGADILAEALDGLVLVPDMFKGSPAQVSWYPIDTEEKQRMVEKFIKEKGGHQQNYDLLVEAIDEAQQKMKGIQNWGVVGLGWGGKLVVTLACNEDTRFKASGQAYGSKLDSVDLEAVTVPHICIASSKEVEPVKAYENAFKLGTKIGETATFPSMHHGWMGGLAKLSSSEHAAAFQEGYTMLGRFLKRHL